VLRQKKNGLASDLLSKQKKKKEKLEHDAHDFL
jgi:hypothetical protein